MRTISTIFCGTLFLLFVAVASSSPALPACTATVGNLVANCGFETGTFAGWTLSGNDVPGSADVLYGVEGKDPLDGISPNNGKFQVFIADLESNATTLSQTLATTAGTAYRITFDLAQDTVGSAAYPNGLSVFFDGVSLFSATNIAPEGYTQYSFYGLAPTASTVLSLQLGNSLGQFLLDDVSVSLAPEPSMLALVLGGGFLAAWGIRRTHRN